MKYENVLPEDFDGVFRFTNWTDEDFVGVWGKKEYHFAANSTSPMVIPEHSPLEIQHIRKKFAKDLAEREFFKSQNYEHMRAPEGTLGNRTMSGIHTASTYSLNDLSANIQKCLKPLEIKRAVVTQKKQTPITEVLSKNEKGRLNTGVVDTDEDLESLARGNMRERALSN